MAISNSIIRGRNNYYDPSGIFRQNSGFYVDLVKTIHNYIEENNNATGLTGKPTQFFDFKGNALNINNTDEVIHIHDKTISGTRDAEIVKSMFKNNLFERMATEDTTVYDIETFVPLVNKFGERFDDSIYQYSSYNMINGKPVAGKNFFLGLNQKQINFLKDYYKDFDPTLTKDKAALSSYKSILRAGLYKDDLLAGNPLGAIPEELINPIGRDQVRNAKEAFIKGLNALNDLHNQNQKLSGSVTLLDGSKATAKGNTYILHQIFDDLLSKGLRTAYNGYTFDEQKMYSIAHLSGDSGLIEKAEKLIATQKQRFFDLQPAIRLFKELGFGDEFKALGITNPYVKEGPNRSLLPTARNTQLATLVNYLPRHVREALGLMNTDAFHDATVDTHAYAQVLAHNWEKFSQLIGDLNDIISNHENTFIPNRTVSFSSNAPIDSYHLMRVERSLYNDNLPIMVVDASKENSIHVQKQGHTFKTNVSNLKKPGYVATNESLAGILRKGMNIAIGENISSFNIDDHLKNEFYNATGHMVSEDELVMVPFKIHDTKGFYGNQYMVVPKSYLSETLQKMGQFFASAQIDQSGKIIQTSNISRDGINSMFEKFGSLKKYQTGTAEDALNNYLNDSAKYQLNNYFFQQLDKTDINRARIMKDLSRIKDNNVRELYLRINQEMINNNVNRDKALESIAKIDGANSKDPLYQKAYSFIGTLQEQQRIYFSGSRAANSGSPLFRSAAWSMNDLLQRADNKVIDAFSSAFLDIAAKHGYTNSNGELIFNGDSNILAHKLVNVLHQGVRRNNKTEKTSVLRLSPDELTRFFYDKISPANGLDLNVRNIEETARKLHAFATRAAKGSRGSDNIPANQIKNVLYDIMEFMKNNKLIDGNKHNLIYNMKDIIDQRLDTPELISEYMAKDLESSFHRQYSLGKLPKWYENTLANYRNGKITLGDKTLDNFKTIASKISGEFMYKPKDSKAALKEFMLSDSVKKQLENYYDDKKLGKFIADSANETITNIANTIIDSMDSVNMTIHSSNGVILEDKVGQKFNLTNSIPMIVFEEGVPYIKVGGNTFSISLSTRYLRSHDYNNNVGAGYIALGIEQLEPYNEIAARISKTKVNKFGTLSAVQGGLNSITREIYENTTYDGFKNKNSNRGMYNFVAKSSRSSSSVFTNTNIGFKPLLKDLPDVLKELIKNNVVTEAFIDDHILKTTGSADTATGFEKLGFTPKDPNMKGAVGVHNVALEFNKDQTEFPANKRAIQEFFSKSFDAPIMTPSGYEANNFGELILLNSSATGAHRYVRNSSDNKVYHVIEYQQAEVPLAALAKGFYSSESKKASFGAVSFSLVASNPIKQIGPGSDMASGRYMHTHLNQVSNIEEKYIDEISKLTGVDYSSLKDQPTLRRFDDRSVEHSVNGNMLISSHYEDISQLEQEISDSMKTVSERYDKMFGQNIKISDQKKDELLEKFHRHLRHTAEGSGSIAQELADIHHMTETSSGVQSIKLGDTTVNNEYLERIMPVFFNHETGQYEGLEEANLMFFKDQQVITTRQARGDSKVYYDKAKGDSFGKVIFKDSHSGKLLTPKEIADKLNQSLNENIGVVDFDDITHIFKQLISQNILSYFNAKSVGSQTTMKLVADSTKHVANTMGLGIGTVFNGVEDIFRKNNFGHFVGQLMDFDAMKLLLNGDIDTATKVFTAEAVKNRRFLSRNYTGKRIYKVLDDLRVKQALKDNVKGFRDHVDKILPNFMVDIKDSSNNIIGQEKLVDIKANTRKNMRKRMFGDENAGKELKYIDDFVKYQKVQDYMAMQNSLKEQVKNFNRVRSEVVSQTNFLLLNDHIYQEIEGMDLKDLKKIASKIHGDPQLQSQYPEIYDFLQFKPFKDLEDLYNSFKKADKVITENELIYNLLIANPDQLDKYIGNIEGHINKFEKALAGTPELKNIVAGGNIINTAADLNDIKNVGVQISKFFDRIKNTTKSPKNKNKKAGELDRFFFNELKIKDSNGNLKTLFELEEHNIVNYDLYNSDEMRQMVSAQKKELRALQEIFSDFEKTKKNGVGVSINKDDIGEYLTQIDYLHRALPYYNVGTVRELFVDEELESIVRGNILSLRRSLAALSGKANLTAEQLLFRERYLMTEILSQHLFDTTGELGKVMGVSNAPEDIKRAEPIAVLRRMIDNTMGHASGSKEIKAKFNNDPQKIREAIVDFLNQSDFLKLGHENKGHKMFEIDPSDPTKIKIEGEHLRIVTKTFGEYKADGGSLNVIHHVTGDDELINPIATLFQELNEKVFGYSLGREIKKKRSANIHAVVSDSESMHEMNYLLANMIGTYQKTQFYPYAHSYSSKTVLGSVSASEQDSLMAMSLDEKALETIHKALPNDQKVTDAYLEMKRLQNQKRKKIKEDLLAANQGMTEAQAQKEADKFGLAFHPFNSFKNSIEDPNVRMRLFGQEEMKSGSSRKTINFQKRDITKSKEFKKLDEVSQRIAYDVHSKNNRFSKEWLHLKRDAISSMAAIAYEEDHSALNAGMRSVPMALFRDAMKNPDSAEAIAYAQFGKDSRDISEKISHGHDADVGQRYHLDIEGERVYINVPSYKGNDETDNLFTQIETNYRRYNESIENFTNATDSYQKAEFSRNAMDNAEILRASIQKLNENTKEDAYKKGKIRQTNFYEMGTRRSGEAEYLAMDAFDAKNKIFSRGKDAKGNEIIKTVQDIIDQGYTPTIAEVSEKFFEDAGVLDKKLSKADRAAKLKELEEEGVVMAISRYPYNYQKSISFAKVYLGKDVSDKHIRSNHFLQVKMNADNDGDMLYATNLAEGNLKRAFKGMSDQALAYATATDNSVGYLQTTLYNDKGEVLDSLKNDAFEANIMTHYKESMKALEEAEFGDLKSTAQLTENAGAPYHSIKNLNSLLVSSEIVEDSLNRSKFENHFTGLNNIVLSDSAQNQNNILKISDRRLMNLFSIGAVESGLSAKNFNDQYIPIQLSEGIREAMGAGKQISERMTNLSALLDKKAVNPNGGEAGQTNWDFIFDSLFKKEPDLKVLIDATTEAEHSLIKSGQKTYDDYAQYGVDVTNILDDAEKEAHFKKQMNAAYKAKLSADMKQATVDMFSRVGDRFSHVNTSAYDLSVQQHNDIADYMVLGIGQNNQYDYNSFNITNISGANNQNNIDATRLTEGILSGTQGEIAGRDILTEIASKRSKGLLGMAMGAGASILLAGMGTQNPIPQIDNSVTVPMDDNVMVREVQAPSYGDNSGYLINVRTSNTDGGATAAALINMGSLSLAGNRQNITVTTRVNQQYTDMPITEAMSYLSNMF